MVTAEIAVALPVLVLLMMAAMTAVMVVNAQLRCVDAAREAARVLARGDSQALARSLVTETGPPGARLTISRADYEIHVAVTAEANGIGGVLPAFDVHAASVAVQEPGVGGSAQNL
jgi:Flp pilus assembly protein TadG